MRRAPNQPEEALSALYGGVFVKAYRAPDAGTLMPQHAHTYPHLSIVARGGVRVWAGDLDLGTFNAPAAVRIAARTKHRFLTLEDDTLVLCVHNADHGEAADVHEEHQLALED